MLNELELFVGRQNFASTAVALGNIKLFVESCFRLFVQQKGKHPGLEFEQVSYMGKRRCRF